MLNEKYFPTFNSSMLQPSYIATLGPSDISAAAEVKISACHMGHRVAL